MKRAVYLDGFFFKTQRAQRLRKVHLRRFFVTQRTLRFYAKFAEYFEKNFSSQSSQSIMELALRTFYFINSA